MTLSGVVERLTEQRRSTSSSVTVKISAAGQLMPEVTVAAGEDDETVQTMCRQAVDGFVSIMAEALPDAEPDKPKGKEKT